MPWSMAMLKAAWHDKPYARLLGAYTVCTILVGGMGNFVQVYVTRGVSDGGLGLGADVVSLMVSAGAVAATITCLAAGFVIDKFGAKKVAAGMLGWAVVGRCISGTMQLQARTAVIGVLVKAIGMAQASDRVVGLIGVYGNVVIGSAFGWVVATAVAALLFVLPKPEDRLGHYTIQILLTSLAWGVAPMLAGELLDRWHISYMALFQLCTVATIAVCLPMYIWAAKILPNPRTLEGV